MKGLAALAAIPAFFLIGTPLASAQDTEFGPGTYLVGVDIEPGLYRGSGPGDGAFEWCFWKRLSGLSGDSDDVIESGMEMDPGQIYVEVKSTDMAFKADEDCGSWTKVG